MRFDLLGPLDWYDERAAASDEAYKFVRAPAIDAETAFGESAATTAEFARLGEARIGASDEFYKVEASYKGSDREYRLSDGILQFRSPLTTEHEKNNWVSAKLFESSRRPEAVIILPHWNAAEGAYDSLANNLRRVGFTAVVLVLPFHGVRAVGSEKIASSFLSANLGRTVRSVRQAVLDTRGLVDWLIERKYASIGVLGASLGSCVAGLVGAHDNRISALGLLLTAGDFADVVWSGRATRHIRQSFEGFLDLPQLQSAWRIISTGTYAARLARRDLRVLVLSGTRDRVVLPRLTKEFIATLQRVDCRLDWKQLNCGHFSLATTPFNVLAFLSVWRFLRTSFAAA